MSLVYAVLRKWRLLALLLLLLILAVPLPLYANLSQQAAGRDVSRTRSEELEIPLVAVEQLQGRPELEAPALPTELRQGKVLLVSLGRQWLYAYTDGVPVYTTAITSGRPELPTPPGTYHIFLKLRHTTFYSPWPVGSPFYYSPMPINYALEWREGGFFLHDSPRRSIFGPGTSAPHRDPVYGAQTGTHGCVTMPLKAIAWVYNWAPLGTTLRITP